MIFVTVGTHEQQFNRLIEYIDKLKAKGTIKEEVIIQTGFSTYEPKYCKWKKLFPYQEIIKLVDEARIVITHGGPSSFIMPLQIGKIPIVVPRQLKFAEHVNNHQVTFTKMVSSRMNNILLVNEIEELEKYIIDYDEMISEISLNNVSNNNIFCKEFESLILNMMGYKEN